MAEWKDASIAPRDGRYILAQTISTTMTYNAAPVRIVRFQQPHESGDCVPNWVDENGKRELLWKWKSIDD